MSGKVKYSHYTAPIVNWLTWQQLMNMSKITLNTATVIFIKHTVPTTKCVTMSMNGHFESVETAMTTFVCSRIHSGQRETTDSVRRPSVW